MNAPGLPLNELGLLLAKNFHLLSMKFRYKNKILV